MLTEETVIDQLTITEDGIILIRRAAWILRDGERIGSPRYHRASYEPGATIDAEASIVKAIAGLVWTPDVITAAAQRRAAALAALVPATEGVQP